MPSLRSIFMVVLGLSLIAAWSLKPSPRARKKSAIQASMGEALPHPEGASTQCCLCQRKFGSGTEIYPSGSEKACVQRSSVDTYSSCKNVRVWGYACSFWKVEHTDSNIRCESRELVIAEGPEKGKSLKPSIGTLSPCDTARVRVSDPPGD